MTQKRKSTLDWAQQERQDDLAWIEKNADIFHLAAQIAFAEIGRGAIVVDTTVQPIPAGGHPFGYFDQETVRKTLDEETRRMVGDYNPEQEVVLVLLKEEERTSTYRIRTLPPGALGGGRQT